MQMSHAHAGCSAARQVLPALSRHIRAAGAAEATNRAFLIAANTMQCAEEYTTKLCGVVSDAFTDNFADISQIAEMSTAELQV